ncbi:MAG: hypothetical protein ACLGHC_00295 [Alphaproteobacteria bacterium]
MKALDTIGPHWWRWLRLAMWSFAALVLILPLVLKAPWSLFDFIAMGIMLAAACGTIELALRASGNAAYRLGAIVAAGAGFLLLWVNLAVGIIGSEDNPLNLLYAAVLAVAVTGALLASFKPGGLSSAMFATAAAQVAVTILALAWGWGAWEPPGAAGILALNLVFAALWALSGGLFRRASLTHGTP